MIYPFASCVNQEVKNWRRKLRFSWFLDITSSYSWTGQNKGPSSSFSLGSKWLSLNFNNNKKNIWAPSFLQFYHMISSCISFLYDSVNSKRVHSPRGICRAFVILSVPTVGNLSESLCPGMGHLSILLQAVNIIPFSICHLKICLFR